MRVWCFEIRLRGLESLETTLDLCITWSQSLRFNFLEKNKEMVHTFEC